ncbi:MAG: hypothetical protein V2A66_01315 [Pseudomonadota bacterium]
MKKLVAGVVVVGTAMIAAAALAWNVGGAGGSLDVNTKKIADKGIQKALQTTLNKQISNQSCTFKGPTADTTCDLKKIGQDLAAAYTGIKEGANYTVYVNIEADDAGAAGKGKKAKGGMSGYDRASKVKDKLLSSPLAKVADSWHYNPTSSNNKGNNLKISVEVK